MQHGCTSGHGLTGLARLSLRSWVAVPTFMASGALAATLVKTVVQYPELDAVEEDTPELRTTLEVAGLMLGVLALFTGLLYAVGKSGKDEFYRYGILLGEFVVGLSFGTGLVLSGMSRASKVGGFLDLGSGAWDGSLMFVMGGALMVTFPYFQIMERCNFQSKAFLHQCSLDLPPLGKGPDRHLVAGAAAFGAGWGICGMCPGPMWVNVGGNPGLPILTAVTFMMLGLFVDGMPLPGRSSAAASDLTLLTPDEKLQQAAKTPEQVPLKASG
eukprot:SRR837773.11789.p1 GENE.SRR837773.11789~~SRR837773.11789.p1  ORF type:complete len:271 (-),score=93.79 SRR837773.11789:5-817(-)